MVDPMRTETSVVRDGRKVVVRPATNDDAQAILEHIRPTIAEEVYLMLDPLPDDLEAERRWLASFDGQRSVLFVAAAGNAIVGQVDCHGGEYSKIQHVGVIGIAIRDGWREVGLGSVLMKRIVEWMRARGFLKAELSVFSTNVRARRLYESLGFVWEGSQRRRIRIRGEFIDEIRMGLWLGPEPGSSAGHA